MTEKEKVCVEIFYDACKMRSAGKVWLGDLDISNREEVCKYAQTLKEEILVELTPDEIIKNATTLKVAYELGEKLAFRSA